MPLALPVDCFQHIFHLVNWQFAGRPVKEYSKIEKVLKPCFKDPAVFVSFPIRSKQFSKSWSSDYFTLAFLIVSPFGSELDLLPTFQYFNIFICLFHHPAPFAEHPDKD
jgi:hypothetical protein